MSTDPAVRILRFKHTIAKKLPIHRNIYISKFFLFSYNSGVSREGRRYEGLRSNQKIWAYFSALDVGYFRFSFKIFSSFNLKCYNSIVSIGRSFCLFAFFTLVREHIINCRLCCTVCSLSNM